MTHRIGTYSEEFGALFTGISKSWFRLETLQKYDVAGEQEQFDAFQAGDSVMPHDPADDEWAAMVSEHVASGRTLQRVHVVTEPLTDYLKYEIAWGYQPAARAGEDVRIVAVPAGQWPASLPVDHDFWLFDDQLWVMAYDDSGRPEYAEHVTDDQTVAEHLEWRRIAIDSSQPLGDFIDASPELRNRTPVMERD